MTKTQISLPLVFTLSVIPDIDILFPFLQHRGPLHSIIVLTAISIPFFIKYRAASIPYYLALIQHPLIADFFIGGNLQLLWPLTTQHYGFGISITSTINIASELSLFIIAFLVLFKSRDWKKLIRHNPRSLLLLIPFSTVLLPSLLGFPLSVPLALLIPHLVYALLFLFSIGSYILNPRS